MVPMTLRNLETGGGEKTVPRKAAYMSNAWSLCQA